MWHDRRLKEELSVPLTSRQLPCDVSRIFTREPV